MIYILNNLKCRQYTDSEKCNLLASMTHVATFKSINLYFGPLGLAVV